MAYNVPLSSINASDGNVTYAQGSVLRVGAGGNVNAVGSVVVNANGNVGIGTTSPVYALEVSGSFAATTKSFVIDHPTKSGMKLRHGSLEGPENGVYVRGRLKGSNRIALPDYWKKLIDPETITVDLTPIGRYQRLYIERIAELEIIVGADETGPLLIDAYFVVFAERQDIERLQVEILTDV